MTIETRQTTAYDDQRPGTAGLRKQVTVYQQPNYLENFIQSIFDAQPAHSGKALVVGGDGRYFNDEAIGVIIRMAAANGFSRVIVGQHGLLSTPNTSLAIRKYAAFGGIILTASHNPGGPQRDFGVKYSLSNGGLAPESVTDAIYACTQRISEFKILDADDPDLSQVREFNYHNITLQVLDSVADYADLMASLFDFDLIRKLLTSGAFRLRFDAMSGVLGPYANRILVEMLGARPEWIVNSEPLPDFGGRHPDPNPVHARSLVEFMNGPDAADFGVAVDGDGDRSMHLGRGLYVSPSDSVAIMAANAHIIPGYRSGLAGVARSLPTGAAIDKVAERLGICCYLVPTGWKFFGNLMDAGLITMCGEESFGCGSDHVREKDAMWAVLYWLNMLAARQQSVADIVHDHWREFGRHYYARYDFEEIDKTAADELIAFLRQEVPELAGRRYGDHVVGSAEDFHYTDPVDKSESKHQGIVITLTDGSRVLYRLSGTGTVEATLRVYAERYEADPARHGLDPHAALSDLFELICTIGDVRRRIGRESPDVIV